MALWKIKCGIAFWKCGTNCANAFKLGFGMKNPKFLWKLETEIQAYVVQV